MKTLREMDRSQRDALVAQLAEQLMSAEVAAIRLIDVLDEYGADAGTPEAEYMAEARESAQAVVNDLVQLCTDSRPDHSSGQICALFETLKSLDQLLDPAEPRPPYVNPFEHSTLVDNSTREPTGAKP